MAKVFRFDSSSDYVAMSGLSDLSRLGHFTLEGWAKKTGQGTANPRAIAISKGAHYIDIGHNGRLAVSAVINSGQYFYETSYVPQMGVWAHYAMTYNGQNLIVYVNGEIVLNVPLVGTANNSSNLYLGRYSGGGYTFVGDLAEVRLWDIARSQEDIQFNMNRKLLGREYGLVGYWSPDNVSGSIALDMTAYRNDGTMNAVTVVDDPAIQILPASNFLTASKIPLSGGAGGRSGQSIYTAPNGVVVTSSAPTYNNNGYYYMEYLFDGSVPASSDPYSYWLTSSSGTQTLTFDFGAIAVPYIPLIAVYPRTRNDASSSYRILGSNDGNNWTPLVDWVYTSNSSPDYGTRLEHELPLNQTYRFIRFELTRNGNLGVTLQEIEFYKGSLVQYSDLNGLIEVSTDSHTSMWMPSRIAVTPSNEVIGSLFIWETREGDLGGSVDVRTLGSAYVSSKMIVRKPNLMEGSALIWSPDASDLPSSLDVHLVGASHLQSKILVLHNDLIGEADIYGNGDGGGDVNSKIDVKYAAQSYINSLINVRVSNILEGNVDITGVDDSDLSSKIAVSFKTFNELHMAIRVSSRYVYDPVGKRYGHVLPSKLDVVGISDGTLKSTIGVKFRNWMTGDTNIVAQDASDILSSINVFQNRDLVMRLGVSPLNKMTAIIDIKQPERFNGYIPVAKDAYVRQSVPKLNYGADQVLASGYSVTKNEVLRSFLTFPMDDFNNLHSDYVVEKVVVRLKFSKGRTPTIPLSLHEVQQAWTEYGITWANMPSIDSTAINANGQYTVNLSADYIDIDVTDYALAGRAQGKNTLDVCLKALNETDPYVQFFSREMGGDYVPQIVYTYYDYVIRSTGRANLDSIINVAYRGSKNLTSKLNVKGYWADKDLPANMEVRLPEQIKGSITVSRPDLQGRIVVKRTENADLTSSVAVQVKDFYDLDDNSIVVSKPFIHSSLYVANRKDTNSKLVVRVWGEDNLFSWGAISAATRPGRIVVNPYYDFNGSITVRREVYSEITTVVQLSEGNKVGSIFVLYHDDGVQGSITVQREEEKWLAGRMIVSVPALYSTIEVNPYSDLNVTIRVQRSDETEIDGSLTVTCPDLYSSVYVRFTADLPAEVAVRRSAESEFAGSIQTSKPDLWSTIHPKIHVDLDGSIEVRVEASDSLNSSIYTLYRKDIPSQFEVVYADRLHSSIIVLSGWLKSVIAVPANDLTEIPSSILPRLSQDKDLTSRIDVYEKSLLDSSITVRQFGSKDKLSSIKVRREGWNDLAGSVDVWIIRNLTSKVVVRRESDSVIPATIEVPDRDDLKLTINVPYYTSLPGSVNVVYSGGYNLPSSMIPRVRSALDIDTTLNVIYGGLSDLKSRLGVTPTNKMTAILDIVEPQRYTTVLSPVKDAYVRESVPTLNYGTEDSLAVGRYNDKVLRTLLGFDLSSLPQDHEIDTVKLKLFFSAGKAPKQDLLLNKVVGSWTEFGVTWNNQPSVGELIEQGFTVDLVEGSVTFDVTEFVNGIYVNKTQLVDFFLRAVDELEAANTYFFSRESGSKYAPQLVVTHFDPIVRSYGRANIDSKIFVVKVKDLNSKIRVRKTDSVEDLLSTVEVKRDGIVEGSITVTKPDLPSRLGVAEWGGSEIPANVVVRNEGLDDIIGSLSISQIYLPSTIYVPNHEDVDSTISVRREVNEDFFSWGYVNAPQRPASINVPYRNDVEWTIRVRGEVWSDLDSTITVNRPNLDGAIIVRQSDDDDITSTIEVRCEKGDDLAGSITVTINAYKSIHGRLTVTVRQIPSTVEVKVFKDNDLPSVIAVPLNGIDDLAGTVAVARPEMPSDLTIPERSDLPSSLSPRVWGEGDLDSIIGVSTPELPSSLSVYQPFDMDSSISVLVWEDADLDSVVGVSKPVIPSSLEVKEVSDIDSSLLVVYPADKDFFSWLEVLERKDLKSSIVVHRVNDLAGNIVVISGNLGGQITVRQSGGYDKPSQIGVRVPYKADLTSQMLIIKDWSFLPSLIKIPVSNIMDGEVVIIGEDTSDLPSTIQPRYSNDIPSMLGVRMRNKMEGTIDFIPVGDDDLPSTIDVAPSSNLPSVIVVRRTETDDLPSQFILRGIDNSDLDSSISVIYRGNADLPSSIGITPYNKMTAKIVILTEGDSDIQCSIVVRRTENSDLPSSIKVRREDHYDIICRINVRKSGDSDIPSTIWPRLHSDLPSNVYVRFNDDLGGTIEVITAYPYAYIM